GEDREQVVQVVLELVEATAEVIVIVPRYRRGPASLLFEDCQLSDKPAQFLIGHKRMNPFEECDVCQCGVRLVELAKLGEDQGISRCGTVETEPTGNGLSRQFLDLSPDPVIHRLKDAHSQVTPGVASKNGREVGRVKMGGCLGSLRFLDPGDRHG